MGCCSLLGELRQVSFHLTNSPQAELLLLPGLLASALISLQSILPAVVRRILLEPKSDPLLNPAQNPPWLHLTQSTAQVLTRSCKDLICPLPPLPPCPHVLPLSASPTLLQPHSSLTLPQVFQTHSHLRAFVLAIPSDWNTLLSYTCTAGFYHHIPHPSVSAQLSTAQRSPPDCLV